MTPTRDAAVRLEVAISASAARDLGGQDRVVRVGRERALADRRRAAASSSCGLMPTTPSPSTSTPLAILVEPETSITIITSKSTGRSPTATAVPRIGAWWTLFCTTSPGLRRLDEDAHRVARRGRRGAAASASAAPRRARPRARAARASSIARRDAAPGDASRRRGASAGAAARRARAPPTRRRGVLAARSRAATARSDRSSRAAARSRRARRARRRPRPRGSRARMREQSPALAGCPAHRRRRTRVVDRHHRRARRASRNARWLGVDRSRSPRRAGTRRRVRARAPPSKNSSRYTRCEPQVARDAQIGVADAVEGDEQADARAGRRASPICSASAAAAEPALLALLAVAETDPPFARRARRSCVV